ncbi:MAG TPA: DEAD/DEAH box helicase, partial [Thermoanaerobaculia bacterium]|nr:DEAD/DEAH box helicase [Thermoanaerobaculia bacterium]
MPPTPLPVDEAIPELLEGVASHGAAVLVAPPGAGKTTRVPPALAAARPGRVVVLEPRRVAARAAARRIAEENGWTLGVEVGWWIRFERRFRPDSRIVFVTEGLLLRWLQNDPFLDGVSTLVFDEFHERALAADLALALARGVRRDARPELAVVVMSATLDPQPLARFLEPAAVVASAGSLHPVELRLDPHPDDRPLERRVAAAVRRAAGATPGDLLVFLPGRAEIERCRSELSPWAESAEIDLVDLYGDLPIERQDAALRPGARRRCVLATNVAETSVTVEGVRAVVDSGLARRLRHDPASGLDRLETVRVARASADQRAGRAGREGPGLCLRLWTGADDLALRPFETPEVRRVDLSGAVLELALWGEPDPRAFAWFEAPETERLEAALRELRDLGALDDRGLTQIGRRLAELPLPPRLGRLVLEGERLGVAGDAALLAAMLAERDPLRGAERGQRATSSSDLLDRLDVLDRRRHRQVFAARDQILGLLGRAPLSNEGGQGSKPAASPTSNAGGRPDGLPAASPPLSSTAQRHRSPGPPDPFIGASAGSPRSTEEALLRAVGAAYLDRLCRRREPRSERAVMVGGAGVRLARESAVRDAELFVAVVVDAGRGGQRAEGLVRLASAVARDWLPEERVVTARELVWDAARERVVGRALERVEDLVLSEREVPVDDAWAAAALLAEHAAEDLGRVLPAADSELSRVLAR